MDFKSVVANSHFNDLMKSVDSMNIDVIKEKKVVDGIGVERKKTMLDFHEIIKSNKLYENCYNGYLQSIKHLTDLYGDYATEFASFDDFVVALFDVLKNNIVQKTVLASSNNKPKRTLTDTEKTFYESKKEEYLRLLMTQAIPSVNLLATAKILENSSIEDIADFIDKTESDIDQLATYFGLPEDKLSRLTALHEYFVITLPDGYRDGNDLTTKKISINTSRLDGSDPKYKDTPNQLKVLAFLENHILAQNAGLIAQGVAFDGFRFFEIGTGDSIFLDSRNLHFTKLAGASRDAQSNFVLDEKFAEALLNIPKKHSKIRNQDSIRTVQMVDGDRIVTDKTLYRVNYFPVDPAWYVNFYSNISLGRFCKVKEYNVDKDTYSFSLYYFGDQEADKGIQLFRIDKVEKMFKGAPASHNLRGKEKIENTLHAHSYNLVDAVLKNYNKADSLGKMDLSLIFPNPDNLDPQIIEEFFDYFCGIHGQYLQRVNEKKFRKLNENYEPLSWSSE